MNKNTCSPTIDIDNVMRAIRDEVALKRAKAAQDSGEEQSKNLSQKGAVGSETKVRVQVKDAYEATELCRFQGIEFVENSYFALLRRLPDEAELNSWCQKLAEGRLTKKEILGRLRYSPEGKTQKVRVSGIALSYFFSVLTMIPLLGKFSKLVGCFFRLPVIYRNIQVLEYALFEGHGRQLSMLMDQIGGRFDMTDGRMDALDSRMDHIGGRFDITDGRMDALDSRMDHIGGHLEVLDYLKERVDFADELVRDYCGKINSFEENIKVFYEGISNRVHMIQTNMDHYLEEKIAKINEEVQDSISGMQSSLEGTRQSVKAIKDLRNNLLNQQRSLEILLREVRGRMPEPLSREQMENIVKEEDHFLDAVYLTFEDQFRGTRQDIKGRQKVYLPYVEQVVNQNDDLVIDIGCGRGEWLELLQENKFLSRGIDLNRAMVSACLDRGLDVVNEDGLVFLEGQEADSLSAVTGFHIVEHLSSPLLNRLIDGALRTLKPGGLVIFESPNPENILVGSCNFYYDPTHKNPIPPELLKFILEARGFVDVEILRLHENQEYLELQDQDISDKIASRFYCAQDYAVIGYKA